ncbi:hypothetical protein HF086_002420 [Spodoptera exigua]|uniref:Uncharacterized protein n=1 Tax=Spodoptera exigua TaxID=7107 RepID=A0A922MEX0_SPOEX|nr:hypothetical protein HF086_002420 [Spodoptera exigua]
MAVEAAGTSRGLRVYKIVVLGDGGVGKSAVTLQFVSHSFLDYHDPTIGLMGIYSMSHNVCYGYRGLIPTASSDRWRASIVGHTGHCRTVTDRRSFRAAAEYRRLLAQARPSERLPLVLVGNKLDLAPRFRQVTTEEGRALATQLGCPFFETSAALRHFVDDAFHALVREIRRLERQRQASILGTGISTSGGRRRWRRLRSIFALVFRRRRRHHTSP